jgi:DNA-binding response OmpR family regulator
MPGLDGFQVCRTIKGDSETTSTVVIAMTGYHTVETEARIVECGAVRCLAKPIEPSAIAAVVDAVLEATVATKRRRKPARA